VAGAFTVVVTSATAVMLVLPFALLLALFDSVVVVATVVVTETVPLAGAV
jgi:hypothetical protein